MRVSFIIYVSLVTFVICISFNGFLLTHATAQEDPLDSGEDFLEDLDMEDPPPAPPVSSPKESSSEEDDDVAIETEEEPVVKFEPLDFETPDPKGPHHFAEGFKNPDILQKRWIRSKAKKDDVDEVIAKYDGEWAIKLPEQVVLRNDYGLVLMSKARHHAISAKFSKPFDFAQEKPLIVQYDINFQSGQECGGAYVKLLLDDKSVDLYSFNDKTPYSIMFGPDKCGLTSKIHFIVQHKNPHSGKIEEKHSKQPEKSIESYVTDKKSHLYTLIVNPDNTYELQIDQKKIIGGNLLESVEPPIVPPKEVEDPDDKKPEDWDDREKISDPEAKKPADWDETLPEFILDEADKKPDGWLDAEPEYIPDPTATKPADWDVDMDGEWEAPKIENPKCKDAPGCGEWKQKKKKNPAYKGAWKAPMITNPAFKGKWKARKIPNPEYFDDTNIFRTLLPIGAVGLELWSMSDGIIFDNFLVTDDRSVADRYAMETWYLKTAAETKLANKSSFFGGLIESANDKPWLWAVYVLVILLPIVLITYFCCTGGKSDDLDPKKTDEVQPDDEFGADDIPLLHNPDAESAGSDTPEGAAPSTASGEVDSTQGGALRSSPGVPRRATRKSDLEASDDDDDEEEEEEEEDEEEEDEEEEKSSSNSPKASPGKSSPRRRARKD